jgi:dTDP-4-dehydrorhamnose reductase
VKSSSSDADDRRDPEPRRAAAARAAGGRPRCIVTGAAGMLGSAVVAAFGQDWDVVPHRRADSDLADLHDTAAWIAARAPQVVVHCAAYTDVDGCESQPERAWRDNAWATRNVALACQLSGAALCHISTDYVFDGAKPEPYVETDATAPLNVYGASKLAAELHVRRHAPHAWIARTSWVFGPGGRNFVRTMRGLLQERDSVRVVDDQRGAPTYTHDLAAALAGLVETAAYGTYHVTNAGACSWYELAQRIGARTQSHCRIEPCTSAEFPRPARRPRNSCLAPVAWRAAGLPGLRPWTEAVDAYLQVLATEAS